MSLIDECISMKDPWEADSSKQINKYCHTQPYNTEQHSVGPTVAVCMKDISRVEYKMHMIETERLWCNVENLLNMLRWRMLGPDTRRILLWILVGQQAGA